MNDEQICDFCASPNSCTEIGECYRRKYNQCAASASAEPVAWVRYRSDGGFEGPIMDTDERMCDTRRTSGAWTPLYARPIEAPDNSDEPVAVASVYENANGETYVQFDVENAEDIPVGTKLYLRPFEMTRQQVEEIAGYIEAEGKACSGMGTLYITAEAAVQETLRRLSLPRPIEAPAQAVDEGGNAV